jgi:hypothetical protein
VNILLTGDLIFSVSETNNNPLIEITNKANSILKIILLLFSALFYKFTSYKILNMTLDKDKILEYCNTFSKTH